MKLCVGLDSDAHFILAKYEDRPAVIKLLKQIHDGDFWADEIEDDFDEQGMLISDEDNWGEFVWRFVQRGTMEIVELK